MICFLLYEKNLIIYKTISYKKSIFIINIFCNSMKSISLKTNSYRILLNFLLIFLQ